MTGKLYRYVGPEAIRSRTAAGPGGQPIDSLEDLSAWITEHRRAGSSDGLVVATFVIDSEGRLRLADRHSEHVACAGGGPVLSAGEMFFSIEGAITVAEVSNHSTGYCPEPESWVVVGEALDRLGVGYPGAFTTVVIFRLCPECGQRNVVKDGWYVCQVCGADLPHVWNLARP
jgi:hypothetical protein